MSAVGHCGNNAAAEGFFGMLKRERVNRRRYRTHAEARTDLFDYIERFHNPRMQRRLDKQDQAFNTLTQPSVKSVEPKGVRDPMEAAEQLDALARDCLDSYAFLSGVRFEEVVKDRAARKSKQYNRPMVGDAGRIFDSQAAAYRRGKDGE